uniref:ABC transporter substrate-binding protein n=1 Tax=Vaginimicrobium propionicum TaxID=1871034 RepID=UPI00097096AE|nr:ABC transporter substrate-binding protein [Vaginimicrobium propionicum]
MRKILSAITALTALTLVLTGCSKSADAPKDGNSKAYRIGITQIVSHPSLDDAREGFKQALADAGLEVEYDEQNAQSDQATASAIANKFAGANLDLILAISTPVAQATTQVITDKPILFTAVTDPVAADLVASNEAPGGNVTGTTDMNPVADQIALVKQVKPDAKTVGIIYSSGEVNSEVQVKVAREAAAKEGLEVVEKTISTGAEVVQAAQALSGVDAIYVPTDNNVVSGLDSVIQVAEDAKIPLIAGETVSVEKGALISVGLDYFTLGQQTGQMAVKILTQGADPATMPVEEQEKPRLVINMGAAKRMGIEIPQALLDKADKKVD